MDHQIAVPNGVVVKVVRREAPLPTLLVSDEVADEGAARVRRLRFFLPDGASSAELVSDHVQTEMLLRTRGRVDRGCLRHLYHRLMIAGLCCQARPAARRPWVWTGTRVAPARRPWADPPEAQWPNVFSAMITF